MKISAYILLASAIFLVAFAAEERSNRASETLEVIEKSSQQNLDASVYTNATIVLKNGYTNGARFVSSSENMIMEGISAAEEMFNEDPEAAKQILLQALFDGKTEIFKSVRDFFQSLGEALALSNLGAKQGLLEASVLLQKAGISVLDAASVGKNAFEQGIDAGGFAAKVLFKNVRLTIETGFAGCYHNIQESIKTADQALRNAQRTPIQGEDENQSCEAPAEDPDFTKAIEEINEAGSSALNRGADAKYVQKFQQAIICELGNVMKVAAQGKQTMQYIRTILESDPEGAKKTYAKQAEAVKKVVHAANARIHLIVGSIALQSGNELKNQMGPAILAMDMGKVEMFLGLNTAGDLIDIGSTYQGDAPMLAVDAASASGFYAKNSYIQGVVKTDQIFLSMF